MFVHWIVNETFFSFTFSRRYLLFLEAFRSNCGLSEQLWAAILIPKLDGQPTHQVLIFSEGLWSKLQLQALIWRFFWEMAQVGCNCFTLGCFTFGKTFSEQDSNWARCNPSLETNHCMNYLQFIFWIAESNVEVGCIVYAYLPRGKQQMNIYLK